jgi:dimethylaniline monooxygenase (N-oxide forming)
MPMERPPEEDCMNDLFRAKYTTKYLDEYVDAKRHSGLSLRERIKFNMDVLSISKVNAKWKIHCADTLNRSTETLLASKIMIANGQSSTPNMPNFQGREGFRGSVIHSIDFGTSTVIKDAAVQHVAVLGAGKSAADMVYESVKAGKTVHWIIRESGSGGLGPAAFAPIDLPTPYKNGVEASQARIMASLQPCFLIPDLSWWTRFLHSTNVGAALVAKIFAALDNTVRKYAGYRSRPSDKGFEMLEYDTPYVFPHAKSSTDD